MERVKRALRWGAWGLLVLFTAGVLVWTVLNAAGSSRLRGAYETLRAAGYETSLARMAPPKPPPARNAGPLYQAAFALLAEPPEGREPGGPGREGGVAALPPADRAALRAWLAENEEAFSLLARARGRDACDFGWDYALGFEMPLPEVHGILRAAKALSLRAQLLALEGKGDAARDAVGDALAVGEALRDKPFLICALVRLVTLNAALEAVGRCVTRDTKEAELRAWLERLPPRSSFDGFLEPGLRGELAAAADLLARPNSGLLRVLNAPAGPTLGASLASLALTPVLKSDGARHLLQMRQMAELCRRPYPECMEEATRLWKKVEDAPAWLHIITRAMTPALSRAFERVAVVQSGVELVRGGLECEIVRAATGRYPERVEARDALTGQPFLYDRAAGWIRSARAAEHPRDSLEWRLRNAGP
jgi:hypothetical protein